MTGFIIGVGVTLLVLVIGLAVVTYLWGPPG